MPRLEHWGIVDLPPIFPKARDLLALESLVRTGVSEGSAGSYRVEATASYKNIETENVAELLQQELP